MQIGELARRAGVTTQTVRFYEQQGLLGNARGARSQNNYRVYGSDALERLQTIAAAKQLGFSLKEIVALGRLWESGQLDAAARVQTLQDKLSDLREKRETLNALEAVIQRKLEQLKSR